MVSVNSLTQGQGVEEANPDDEGDESLMVPVSMVCVISLTVGLILLTASSVGDGTGFRLTAKSFTSVVDISKVCTFAEMGDWFCF